MADKRTGACSVDYADSSPTSKIRPSLNGSNKAGQKDRAAAAATFRLCLRSSSRGVALRIRTIFAHSRNAFRRGEKETARSLQRTERSDLSALDVSATNHFLERWSGKVCRNQLRRRSGSIESRASAAEQIRRAMDRSPRRWC